MHIYINLPVTSSITIIIKTTKRNNNPTFHSYIQ